jgi:tetratricopeptide (TPR) repeat protein
MDWRKSLWLSGGLLCAALGCMKPEAGALVPPAKPPAEPVAKSSEKPKTGKPSASTLVTVANLRLEVAADPSRDEHDQKRLARIAVSDFQDALKVDKKYLPAHIGLAKSLELAGDTEKAFAAYKAALKIAPKEAALWYELGMARARAKAYPQALEALAKAAGLAPDNPTVTKSLGFTLARAGRFDEGLAWLMKAMNESDAHFNLARMAHHLGQVELCARHTQLAVQLNPQNEEAQYFLASLRGAPQGEIRTVGAEVPAQ